MFDYLSNIPCGYNHAKLVEKDMSYKSLIGVPKPGSEQVAYEMLLEAFQEDLSDGFTFLKDAAQVTIQEGQMLVVSVPEGEQGKQVLRLSGYNCPRAVVGSHLNVSFGLIHDSQGDVLVMAPGFQTDQELLGYFLATNNDLPASCLEKFEQGMERLSSFMEEMLIVPPLSDLGQQLIALCGTLNLRPRAEEVLGRPLAIYNCCSVPPPPKPSKEDGETTGGGAGDEQPIANIGEPSPQNPFLQHLVYQSGLTLIGQVGHQSGDIARADC